VGSNESKREKKLHVGTREGRERREWNKTVCFENWIDSLHRITVDESSCCDSFFLSTC